MGQGPDQAGKAVKVDPFWIDRTEVTVTAYLACVAQGRCTAPGSSRSACNGSQPETRGGHPINCVTWEQANQYCVWAGKRLPRESEWEFAARGTDGRRYPWGNGKPTDQACSGRFQSGTCPAGSKPADASPFGVLDMAGNVKEWTASTEDLPEHVKAFVVRGGGWQFDGLSPEMPVSVTERDSLLPSDAAGDLGFRCAADLRRQ